MDERRARELLAVAVAADRARGGEDDPAMGLLRTSIAELGPATDHLVATDPTAALRFVAALSGFWQDAGLVDEGRHLAQRVIDELGADGEDLTAVCDARLALAELAFRQGDQEVATGQARAGIEAADRAGYRSGASLGWSMLARVAFRDDDGPALQYAADRALDLAGEDQAARRGALHMQAWAAYVQGDTAEARRRFETSLAYRRAIRAGPLSEAVELSNIADLDLEAGQLVAAADAFGNVLETARQLQNAYLLVNTVPSAGAVAAAAGRLREAAELYGVLDGMIGSTGLTPDPGADRAKERRLVEEQLGEHAFSAALARGRSHTAPEGTELAIRTCRLIAEAIER